MPVRSRRRDAAGSNDAASCLIAGLCRRATRLRRQTVARRRARHCRPPAPPERSKAIAAMRRGGIVANARQRAQRIEIFREVSVVPLDNDLRASVQIASAGVVAEARPRRAAHRPGWPRPASPTVGHLRQEPCVVRRDGFDGGLLQHDFGQPDSVRHPCGRLRPRARATLGRAGRTKRADRRAPASGFLPLTAIGLATVMAPTMA